jgi:hypothetical protein
MALNLSGFGGVGEDPSVMGWGDTQTTDYSTNPIIAGNPSTVVDTPRSDGITWGGVLSGVESTANTLLDTFGKFYKLEDSVASAQFQREIKSAQLDITRAQALGSLDVQKVTTDAQVQIAKAQAARAVADQLARTNSGSAGYIVQQSAPLLKIGAVLLGAFLVYRVTVKK